MTVEELIEYLEEYKGNTFVVLDKGHDGIDYDVQVRFTVESTGDGLQNVVVIY